MSADWGLVCENAWEPIAPGAMVNPVVSKGFVVVSPPKWMDACGPRPPLNLLDQELPAKRPREVEHGRGVGEDGALWLRLSGFVQGPFPCNWVPSLLNSLCDLGCVADNYQGA